MAEFFALIASLDPSFDPTRQPPAPLDAFTRPRGGVFLLANLAGTPVGCAGVRRLDDHTAELRRVFVRDHARGCGVGRSLLASALVAARDLGYDRIRLDTGSYLRAAQALFRSVGFREIDDYNGNPFAGLWMELELAPPSSKR